MGWEHRHRGAGVGYSPPRMCAGRVKTEPIDDERWAVSVFTGSVFEMLGVVADRRSAELLRERITAALCEAVLCDRDIVRKFRDRKLAEAV